MLDNLGHQETQAMESQGFTEPKLIDFFKSEMPLREERDMEKQTYLFRPGDQQLDTRDEVKGASPEPAIAIAIADGGPLQLEPSSGIFVDFLSGNGDRTHQLGVDAAVSRSSSGANEVKYPMALAQEWSLVARPNLSNVALKLLSPTSTGTQESGTSAPRTPTFDMELNSRRPCVSIPDQYEYSAEGSTFCDDSGRFRSAVTPNVVGSYGGWKLGEKEVQFNGEVDSRVYSWAPDSSTSHGRKRLKIRAPRVPSDGDDAAPVVEVSTQTQVSRPSQTCRKLRERDDENEAVLQAATSLLSLSSSRNDDWRPSTRPRRPDVSLARVGEGERKSERESGEVAVPASSSVGCGSVLSRPSNKRRYRLVSDLLAESPRVR